MFQVPNGLVDCLAAKSVLSRESVETQIAKSDVRFSANVAKAFDAENAEFDAKVAAFKSCQVVSCHIKLKVDGMQKLGPQ